MCPTCGIRVDRQLAGARNNFFAAYGAGDIHSFPGAARYRPEALCLKGLSGNPWSGLSIPHIAGAEKYKNKSTIT